MEHVKRLVLVPEHIAEQRKKPLAAPLATQVNEIDSDMQILFDDKIYQSMKRQSYTTRICNAI